MNGDGTLRETGSPRARGFRALRVAVTIGAFAVIFARTPVGDVVDASRALSPSAFAAALFWVLCSIALGALRWRTLLSAYGATELPSYRRLLHLYFVGLFYNTFVPGGVGGDVVRGVASREAFGDDPWVSTTGGLAVVFVERVCGVVALLALSAGAFMLWPIEGVEGLWRWAAVGLLGAVGAVIALGAAPRVARRLSGRPRRLLASVPALVRGGSLAAALVVSFGIQLANVCAGHAVVSALAPFVCLSDSAVAMPLIGASAFFPLTVGGAGVRELAFAALYHTVGVPEAMGYAASLAYWAAQLVVASVGGVLSLVAPIGKVTVRADV